MAVRRGRGADALRPTLAEPTQRRLGKGAPSRPPVTPTIAGRATHGTLRERQPVGAADTLNLAKRAARVHPDPENAALPIVAQPLPLGHGYDHW